MRKAQTLTADAWPFVFMRAQTLLCPGLWTKPPDALRVFAQVLDCFEYVEERCPW